MWCWPAPRSTTGARPDGTGGEHRGAGRRDRRSSISSISLHRSSTGETLVEGRQVQVIVDHETMRPKTVPDYLRGMIARQEGW